MHKFFIVLGLALVLAVRAEEPMPGKQVEQSLANPDGKAMVFSLLMGSVGSTETAHAYQDKIAGAVAGY